MRPINQGLARLPRQADRLGLAGGHTYVDSSDVLDKLGAMDHQLIVGRAGTGKTATLAALWGTLAAHDYTVVYVNLERLASEVSPAASDPNDRAVEFFDELMLRVGAQLLDYVDAGSARSPAATAPERLHAVRATVRQLAVATGRWVVDGEASVTDHDETRRGRRGSISGQLGVGSVGLAAEYSPAELAARIGVVEVKGVPLHRLAFADLASLVDRLGSLFHNGVWLLLDNWHDIAGDFQAHVGDLVRRSVMSSLGWTVKITAEPYRVRYLLEDSAADVGMRPGRHIQLDVDLDDIARPIPAFGGGYGFMTEALARHTRHQLMHRGVEPPFDSTNDFVVQGFKSRRVLRSLIRYGEGIARGTFSIAAGAAVLADDRQVSDADVKSSAVSYYQGNKDNVGHEDAQAMYNWLIDKVLKERRVTCFAVEVPETYDPDRGPDSLIERLYSANVLHLVVERLKTDGWKNKRFNVYKIDFGAYLEAIGTPGGPLGSVAPNKKLATTRSIRAYLQGEQEIRSCFLDPREEFYPTLEPEETDRATAWRTT